MKETDFNEAQESKEENIDVKELLFKYLIHWPWFVGAVVACLIAAWVYLYVSTPVYNISATVLIKDDKKGGECRNAFRVGESGIGWYDLFFAEY